MVSLPPLRRGAPGHLVIRIGAKLNPRTPSPPPPSPPPASPPRRSHHVHGRREGLAPLPVPVRSGRARGRRCRKGGRGRLAWRERCPHTRHADPQPPGLHPPKVPPASTLRLHTSSLATAPVQSSCSAIWISCKSVRFVSKLG
jgi:hypothetical protein